MNTWMRTRLTSRMKKGWSVENSDDINYHLMIDKMIMMVDAMMTTL